MEAPLLKDRIFSSPRLVPCNLCGTSACREIFPSTLRTPDEKADFSVFGSAGEHPPVVQCEQCGLVYANPPDDGEWLARQYLRTPVTHYLAEKGAREQTARADAALVCRHVSPGPVLDVGCSAGLFLHALPPEYPPLGIEPSVAAATEARKLLGEHAVINMPLEKTELPQNHFQAITLWDVIEHLSDPAGTVRHLVSRLRPGGALFLVTPDFGSLFARLTGPRWPHLVRHHLFFFTQRSLTKLLEASGLRVLSISTHTCHFSLRYLLERAGFLAVSPEGNGKKGHSPLMSAIVPVNLGDAMLVVAVKPSLPQGIGQTGFRCQRRCRIT
ncbi:MAG: class I SAM-dependent methyltransferase [Magnetococcales bacterium]|nr:class I SAM-dependent methyltransferase [Magnetococcales bacterium]MBF0321339.1 class I SAM-dependent methyltransferase [Magnetococcales bacterium]